MYHLLYICSKSMYVASPYQDSYHCNEVTFMHYPEIPSMYMVTDGQVWFHRL